MREDFYYNSIEVINKYITKGIYIYYICGGRGIGKSYSAYHLCKLIGCGEFSFDGTNGKFLYLRRTGVEAEIASTKEGNAFKKYNKNEGVNIQFEYKAKISCGSVYIGDSEEREHIGYISALSTFSNARGIDYSDVQFILYDECIPETKNKTVIKREGTLVMNMIETINRNRELEGYPPVVFLMVSNPIDLSNQMLSELNITPILSSMVLKNQERYTNYKRHLHIERIVDHEVSRAKKNTVLYEFAEGTSFVDESLSGEFVNNDTTCVGKVNLSEYIPLLTLEDSITVYQHKSMDRYFISTSVSKAKHNLKITQKEKLRNIFYWKYKLIEADNLVMYDNYNTKVVFESMINYKPLGSF